MDSHQDGNDTIFSDEDLRLFYKVAVANDLIDPSQVSTVDSNHQSPCQEISEIDMFAALAETGELGDLDPYCLTYLEANEATPDHKSTYWIAVLAITLVLRILTGLALKRRSNGLLQ